MKNGIIIMTALAICLISLATFASAAAVGISPATLSFSIPRGGEETKTVEISTNSETPLAFIVSIDPVLGETVDFEAVNDQTVKGEPGKIVIKAHSLRSSQPGKIEGAITAVIKDVPTEPSGSGSRVATAVAARINVEITNEKVPLIKNKLLFATIAGLIVLAALVLGYFLIGAKSKEARRK